VYVWDVNLTVTKHSDYFVWKDTSEHDSTLRRHQLTRSERILVFYDTPFFEGVQEQKNPEMLSLTRYKFQFSKKIGWRRNKRWVLIDQFIWCQRFWEDVCFTVIYVYRCMCICISMRMHVFTCVYVCVCIFVHRLWVSVAVLRRVWAVSWMHMCIHAHMYACA